MNGDVLIFDIECSVFQIGKTRFSNLWSINGTTRCLLTTALWLDNIFCRFRGLVITKIVDILVFDEYFKTSSCLITLYWVVSSSYTRSNLRLDINIFVSMKSISTWKNTQCLSILSFFLTSLLWLGDVMLLTGVVLMITFFTQHGSYRGRR